MALVVMHPSIASQGVQSQKTEMPIGDSKFLQQAIYDPQSLQLTVTMKNGAQYIHFYVYPNVMEEFKQARSKGEFYSRVIKGKSPSTRVISKAVGKNVAKKNEKGRKNG